MARRKRAAGGRPGRQTTRRTRARTKARVNRRAPHDPAQRHLYLVGHSWVVAVPKLVREHLGLRPSAPVYWHLAGPAEAIVTKHAQRIGGKPAGLDLANQLAKAHALNDRMKQKLQARPLRVLNEGMSQGFGMAQRISNAFADNLVEVRDELRAIRAELGMRPPGSRPRAWRPGPARRRPVEAIALPDELPSPPSPPSPARPTTCPACGALMLDDERCPACGSSGGDAASGGEATQAAHE